MDKIESESLKANRRNRLVMIFVMVLVFCVFFLYLASTKKKIDEYAYYTLNNQFKMASESIDATLNDARRSIVAAAGDVAAGWKEDKNFNIVAYVETIKERYDFDVLEFVDAKGINLMSGANRFDASDREYYKKGIKGETGLWVNFSPRESQEYLLDYYSPVYYKGEIVGVLVGALGSKQTLEHLTKSTYLGRECIGVLYDGDDRVIAASFGAKGEIYAPDIYDMYNLTPMDRRVFSQHVRSKEEIVFTYEGDRGVGIACTGKINVSGWGLIIIIPSKSFSSIYGDFTNTGIITFGAVIIIVCIYIVYIVAINRHEYTAKLRENDEIIKGFSKVYHSVYMLNYNEGTARCIRTRDPSAAKYGISEGGRVSISDEFINYLLSGVDKGDQNSVSSLVNPMYVKTMMKDREYFSISYKLLGGGSGSLDIADMSLEESSSERDMEGNKPKEQFDRERYLLGMVESAER